MIDLGQRPWTSSLGANNRGRQHSLRIFKFIAKEGNERGWSCLCAGVERGGSCWVRLGKYFPSASEDHTRVFKVEFPRADPSSHMTAIARVFPLDPQKDPTQSWKREISVSSYLSNLVEKGETTFFPLVYAVIKCSDSVVMLTERSWGDLVQFATYLKTSYYTLAERIKIWTDLLEQVWKAIQTLQRHGIVHCHLIARNVLVDGVLNGNKARFKIKIHHFGHSRPFQSKMDVECDWLQFLQDLSNSLVVQ